MIFTTQGIQIGLLTFNYYGFIIVLAVALSMILVNRRLKVRQLETHDLVPLTITVFITAIIGARIWYACFPPPAALRVGLTAAFYWDNLLELLSVWQGGLALPGAVIGGILGFLFFSWKHQLNRTKWLRATAIVIPFAAAIIFWGNYLNHEHYGLPSALPWAITIAPEYRVPGYTSLATYHPLFLYQSLWALLATVVVILYERKAHRDRLTVPLIGTLLSIGFLALETIRIDAGFASTMNMAFWTVLLVFSLMRLYFLHRRK